MKEGTLDRSTFEAIEAYVLDRMPADARAVFEHRLAQDPSLREELELERENIQAVELGGLDRMLKGIAREERAEERPTTSWTRYLGYAALVAGIVSGTIWWMGRPPLTEQLYAEHFVPDPGLPVKMGTGDNTAFTDAMVAYKLGDYDEASTKWGPLLAREPANDTLRYYIASAWLAETRIAEAVPMLEALVKESTSAYTQRARWYLYLAYLHQGDTTRAGALGLASDPVYGERVRAISARLSD